VLVLAAQFYLCRTPRFHRSVSVANLPPACYVSSRPDSFLLLPPHMLTGTVKFFNDSKGFGFIIADDTQEEIFVHQTGLVHEIQEGDRVQFNIKAGKKGPNAVEVTRIQ
jgi:CspA family cold shock protein